MDMIMMDVEQACRPCKLRTIPVKSTSCYNRSRDGLSGGGLTMDVTHGRIERCRVEIRPWRRRWLRPLRLARLRLFPNEFLREWLDRGYGGEMQSSSDSDRRAISARDASAHVNLARRRLQS